MIGRAIRGAIMPSLSIVVSLVFYQTSLLVKKYVIGRFIDKITTVLLSLLLI
jgi:hypothetical protein